MSNSDSASLASTLIYSEALLAILTNATNIKVKPVVKADTVTQSSSALSCSGCLTPAHSSHAQGHDHTAQMC